MSAIRGADRRSLRSHKSSPYAGARKAPSKKSQSWTFSLGGLLSYINPLRSRSPAELDEEEDDDVVEDVEQNSQESAQSTIPPTERDATLHSPNDLGLTKPFDAPNPAASLSARGYQLANGFTHTPNRNTVFDSSTPPRAASNSPPVDGNISPAESLQKVLGFMREKEGQPLSEWEQQGIISYLEKNVNNVVDNNEKREPFHFSASPSRTPTRGNSPFTFGAPATPANLNSDSSSSPRRTLSRNPNGTYKWQGGGSSLSRNKYQSPSFGSRASPTIKLSPMKTDTKRRRVGEEAESSSSQRVPFPAVSPQKPKSDASAPVPAPVPSQTRPNIFSATNGATASTFTSTNSGNSTVTSKSNGASAPRLRTSGLPTKPTAPPIPSPLRQAWGQSDSPPHSPASKANVTPTKAASFMADLIKEVTPPSKPDLSNPYQTASPVKPTSKKPGLKKVRASMKPAAPAPSPAKAIEPSPQAIIEATVPKGSKRSRPPPDLFKSSGSPPPANRRSPPSMPKQLPLVNGQFFGSGQSLEPMIIEEVLDDGDDGDDEDRSAKKQRMSPPKQSVVTIEEIDDVDMPLTNKSAVSPLVSHPTEIIEPDGRNSSKQTPLKSPPSASPSKPTFAPKEPSKLRYSYQVDKDVPSPPTASTLFTASKTFDQIFEPPAAPRFTAATLPGTNRAKTSTPVIVDPKRAVVAMSPTSLPTFTFPSSLLLIGSSTSNSWNPAELAATAQAESSLPTFNFSGALPSVSKAADAAFDWAAAGMKIPTTISRNSWTCDVCMLSNTAPDTKCIACEAPKKAATHTVQAFNWSAAGLKAPGAATDQWTCSTCMLSNPGSAIKCTVCESSR